MRVLLLGVMLLCGCASQWKVQGGPKECTKMCADWGMQLTGMVGVGKQGRSGGGASACVCELPSGSAGASTGASGTSASTSAAIVAMQVQQQQQQQAAHH